MTVEMSELEFIPVLDHGFVKHIESWGSDELIVESARMSTNKGFQGWGPKEDGKPGDEKLLRYLYEHKHMSPFEMAGMIVEMQVPNFVAKQILRHRTGAFNEMSARYAEVPDVFYVPTPERLILRDEKNKQAGSKKQIDRGEAESCANAIRTVSQDSYETYQQMLQLGTPREVARSVLGTNFYTRLRVQFNLRNWLHFLSLRDEANTQWETQQFAKACAALLAEKFPRTYALYAEGRE